MRFISNLFRRHNHRDPKRDDWLKISTAITAGFESDANLFFQAVVRTIDTCPLGEWPGGKVLRPVHRIIGGKAEIAIKAYELSALSGLLDAMKYIQRPQGHDFCDLVFGQVCGSALSDILGRIRIEDGLTKDARAARFSGDITRFILNMEMDNLGCILIATVIVPALEPMFQCHIGMTVAQAFGDDLNFQSFKKQASDMHAHLRYGQNAG